MMKIPAEQFVRSAIVSGIQAADGEPGVYVVHALFDGTPEVFHIELEGPTKSSFHVREHSYHVYRRRCPTMKGIVPLMRKWHRGERLELPVDLANVHFG
jgi:hypothetical protein